MMASKSAQKPPKEADESRLLIRGPYDAKQEFEINLHQSFVMLQSQLVPPYQIPSHSAGDFAQLNQALVYGFLTQPRMQQSLLTNLAAITTDGYACFMSILLRLVNEYYPKLLDQSRTQLLWLVRQLINLSASEVESLCISLLRCIVGGDASQWNVWLSGQMLDILRNNWTWLIGNPGLLTSALFTFLRLLPDHFMAKSPMISELRQDETAFCVKILRNCFHECLAIGRDLVRLLQDVAFIPEFESIWRDLLSSPSSFNSPGFTNIAQLYALRTPARYLTSRLTPDMESQIRFMLTFVRMGNQRRYQTWFSQRFLSAPGSETLVCDLIRFICCVHHPPNHILQSDIVPRWAVVGWLLKCCKNLHVEANAKLALFYDWFFFTAKTDNLMNIEPALLLMIYSIPKYTDITHSLMEFMFLCMENYDPLRKDLIVCGVKASVDILINKGVVRSLEPLTCSPHVVPWLREKLVAYFPSYSQINSVEAQKNIQQGFIQQNTLSISLPGMMSSSVVESETDIHEITSLGNVVEKEFVGNDMELGSQKMETCNGIMENKMHKRRRIDIVTVDDLARALERSQEEAVTVFEKLIISFIFDAENSIKSERNHNQMTENSHSFAQKISDVVKSSRYKFFAPIFGYSADFLESDELKSVTSAVFRIYAHCCHPRLLEILLAWRNEGHAVGARFVCYICRLSGLRNQPFTFTSERGSTVASENPLANQDSDSSSMLEGHEALTATAFSWHKAFQINELCGTMQIADSQDPDIRSNATTVISDAFNSYKEYIKGALKQRTASPSPPSCNLRRHENSKENLETQYDVDELELMLLQDLQTCLTWSIQRLLSMFFMLFTYIPDLYRGKTQIIKLLVSALDPHHLTKLEMKLNVKDISVLGMDPDYLTDLIRASISWDCFEQQYLWRILVAELQNTTPFLVKTLILSWTTILNPLVHHDALSGLLLFLRMQWPTSNLVEILFGLPKSFDQLVSAVFASWVSLNMRQFLDCLNSFSLKVLRVEKEGCENHRKLSSLTQSDFVSFLDKFAEGSLNLNTENKAELLQIKDAFLGIKENSLQ